MKVLLTGATGFVGSEVLRQLFENGHVVRVIARDPARCDAIRKRFNVEVFHGNILHAPALDGCMAGMDAVIHLVGIIAEAGENTFDRVHRIGTENLIAEAKKAKTKRFVFVSALGTRENARSRYHQSKWAAEAAVRGSGLDWTIFRPSVIYGPGDAFVNLFARMTRWPLNLIQCFTLPVIQGGNARLQPIPVADVARCFAGALMKPEAIGKTYDLCGPAPLRLREIIRTIAEVLGHETEEIQLPLKGWIGDWSKLLLPMCMLKGLFVQPRVLLVPVPVEAAVVVAWLMETFMTKPLLNRDQLLMLGEDNVGDPSEAMKDFVIRPPNFREGISVYLK
ncbi:MAG: complex I NDUFA9 subunit family protein [Verrucomicrobia bacterium]|nr:complex I NDUFA9 subunit family protein [Verrucomicrobiota bacterium]